MSLKRLILATLLAFVTVICASAQSKVYLFIPKVGNTDFTLFIDGEQKAKLNTPTAKTIDNSAFKIPLKQSMPGWVEIDFTNEGKVLLAVSMEYTNSMTLEKNTMQAETQIDLNNGETIFIEVARKGWNDCQIKVLDEKKATKKKNDKKSYQLPKIEVNNE